MTNELTDILVVEDEEQIRKLTQKSLVEIGGYAVETLSSGIDIVDKVAELEPDLLLLDVMMPIRDGIETLERLKANKKTKEIPVILFTAKVRDEELEKYRRMDVAGIIQKPFDATSLPEQVQKLWGRAN